MVATSPFGWAPVDRMTKRGEPKQHWFRPGTLVSGCGRVPARRASRDLLSDPYPDVALCANCRRAREAYAKGVAHGAA